MLGDATLDVAAAALGADTAALGTGTGCATDAAGSGALLKLTGGAA